MMRSMPLLRLLLAAKASSTQWFAVFATSSFSGPCSVPVHLQAAGSGWTAMVELSYSESEVGSG